MKDDRRDQLQEQYEEAAFSLLMDQYAEEEGKRLLLEFEEAERKGDVPEIPPELDEKCLQLIKGTFAKKRRKDRIRRIARKLTSAAALVLLFLGLATTLVMSVDAIRIPVMNFFLYNETQYSSLFLGEDRNPVPFQENITSKIKSAPLPSDYELIIDRSEDNGTFFLCYQNTEGHLISFTTYLPDCALNYDTENIVQTELTIYDHPAFFIVKDGYRVIWLDSDENMACDFYATNLDENLFWEIVYIIAE